MQSVIDISSQAVRYKRSPTNQWLIGLLIAEIASVSIPVGILSMHFRFPDILREPASVALPLFAANESVIVPAYYVFMLSGLLYLPISILLQKQLNGLTSSILLNLVVGFGGATALFQATGFSRWIFAVPYLSHSYEQATGNRALQQSIAVLYDALNRYLGMTVGEHLGFMAMGGWTVCLALYLLKSGCYPRWLSMAGILIGALIIVSIGEHFETAQSDLFGFINFLANIAWTLWLAFLAYQFAR